MLYTARVTKVKFRLILPWPLYIQDVISVNVNTYPVILQIPTDLLGIQRMHPPFQPSTIAKYQRPIMQMMEQELWLCWMHSISILNQHTRQD